MKKTQINKLLDHWVKQNPKQFKELINWFLMGLDDDRKRAFQHLPNLHKHVLNSIKKHNNFLYNYLDDDGVISFPQNKPKTKSNYIGIEVECFSDLAELEILALIVEHKLDRWVDVVGDGSIQTDYGQDYEFRLLVKEKELVKVLSRFQKLLKAGKFGVNDSCGLHIHIDMRRRNMEQSYNKLIKFQDLLFGMVKDTRHQNMYCEYVTRFNEMNRYTAINKLAYAKHKTLEVRLHHGTLNTKAIENWINLLLKIINSESTPKLKDNNSVMAWLGKSKKLKTYVSKTYEPDWKNHEAVW